MKRFFFIISLIIISSSYAFIFRAENSGQNSITLKFVTHNGYGNNLYIDNVTVGKQFSNDIKITSFINLPSDTLYSVNAIDSFHVDTVKAIVTNVGRNSISNAKFTLEIPELGYIDSDTIFSISPKTTALLYFKKALFPQNITYNAKLYLTDTIDTNPGNDTLKQSFGYFTGNFKRVFFEGFTSTTSSSAAVNNPSLNNFVNSKFDSIVAVNYHLGFPAPGNDSLYLFDTIKNNERKDYYDIVSVPNLIFNGIYFSNFPFSTAIIQTSFDTLKKSGSPLTINVTDTRLQGDTISTSISVNITSPVKKGNYYLRVFAVERKKQYASAPGNNGETIFYDIFRDAIPNTQGTPIPTTIGSYNYNFKYLKNAAWADSMTYTVAFIQDDISYEVLNAGKSRNTPSERFKQFTIESDSPVFASENLKVTDGQKFLRRVSNNSLHRNFSDTSSAFFYLEQFETQGLPVNWSLAHLSELITFENVYNSGINGPNFPGVGSMRMNFYSNPDIGQMDTLFSPVIQGVTSLDTLKFDYSYAGYLFNEGDSLYVYLSTDGGLTFPKNIFYKGGIGMATSSSTTISFVPTLTTQWRTVSVPLTDIIQDNYSIGSIKNYKLNQNYPNPFNPVTKISFELPVSAQTLLIIYDISGREISKLVNQNLPAGFHEVNFNGEFLSSGIYFYKLTTPGFTQSKKMVLIK
jgi:hypothetical protein